MERILIVDDNHQNIQLLGNLLAENNYDIEYAQNGAEAVETVRSYDFDLILMDVQMPEMDGFEACKKIKQMESRADIPLIFITARIDTKSINKGFEYGGVDYISKPFNPVELLARIKTHISLKKGKDQLREINKTLEAKVEERTIELRESNEQLRRANEELEVLDTAKSEFLSIISHEIRTPLNGILGFIDFLKDTSEDEHVQDAIEAMDTSCMRLEEFSENALQISRINTKGAEALEKENVNVQDLIDAVILSLQDTADKNGQVFSISVETGLVVIDVQYMMKCIRTLVSNAIQHSPVNGNISIRGEIKSDYYTITIQDEGKGFPELIIRNGIKAFVSLNHVDSNPGIDLYLCKLIVEAHNGQFSIQNNYGGNVTFKIPIANDQI